MTFASILAIIRLLLSVKDAIAQIVAAYQAKHDADWDQRIAEGIKAYAALVTAKTPEEKANAQKHVADGWLHL